MRSLILLTPFVAALVALKMRDRLAAMIVFFAYLSVEGLLKLLANYHPFIHIGLDVTLATIVGVWIAMALVRREAAIPRVPLLLLIVLHVAWVVLLVFSPYTASLYVGVASWKVHLTMIPLYFVGYLVARDPDAPRRFLRAMTIIWTGAFVLTLIQYVSGPGGPFDLGETYMRRLVQYHEWRPFGTTALPGGEGIFAFFAIPFAFCLVLRGDYRLRDPWIIATIVTGSAVFFVSGVRQVFLGCLLMLFTMVGLQVIRGRGRAAGALLVTLLAGAATYLVVREYVVPQVQRTLAQEEAIPEVWRERNPTERFEKLMELSTYASARRGGLDMIWDRVRAFPFGAGLGRTGSAAGALQEELTRDPMGKMIQDRYGFQDNFFAAMLVETGIPGTLLLTGMLIGLLVYSVRLARQSPDPADAAFGAMVAGYMVAMLITSWGSQPLLANPTLAFFWFLGGMAAARHSEALEAAKAHEPMPAASPAVQYG
jgi:hypothetical protein